VTANDRLRSLIHEERVAFCREVMENLSDLVEDEAPEDFCQRVDDLLGDCQPFRAYRDTLAATIDLLRDCRDWGRHYDDEMLQRCAARARTGDAEDGLGKDTTVLEPFASAGFALPRDAFAHLQVGGELSTDTEVADHGAFWRGALGTPGGGLIPTVG